MKAAWFLFKFLLLLYISVGFSGCGGESYVYESERDEQAGPGLFSGEEGELTLFQYEKKPKPESSEQENKKAE